MVGVILIVSACGDSDRSAESFAMSACFITQGADGSYSRPARPPDETTWDIDDPLEKLEEVASAWDGHASSASAAAQIDSSYASLATLTAEIASMRREVVSTRKQHPTAVFYAQIYPLRDWSFVYNFYNSTLNRRTAECNGLSARLNN